MNTSHEHQQLLNEIEKLQLKNKELSLKEQNLALENDYLKNVLKANAHELQISKEEFKALSDNIPVIVWTADAKGNVDYYNQRWYELTGMNYDQTKDWGWSVLIHPADLQHVTDNWKKSIINKTPYKIEYRFKNLNGEGYRWHLSRAIPVRDDQGNVLKWFGTNTDIDEQKQVEKQKDEFISIASHELKTPLTTIKAFFQLFKKAATNNEKANNFIDKAANQLARLEKLISDLLDVSKINAGQMIYNHEEFNFDEAIRESVESIQHTVSTHEITVDLATNVSFKGDRLRIEQVINNFLTNAIKYSPDSNEIVLRSEVQQNSIIVSIQDFGIGIEAENLNHLFDRYYRINNSSMRFQGLGLGLYISAEIIKRHNGSFWIESEPGKGSTFYFLLPINGKHELLDISTDGGSYYKGNFIEITYNAVKDRLDVDWIGYQNYDSVKKGCLIMLDLLEKNECSKVLNDNTHVMGNWSEAVDWGGEVWFPAMEKAGLEYFAWIYSQSTFSKMSAKKSLDITIGKITAQFFTEKQEAINWLEAQ
jgi:PAS domain S-box-containing protein